MRRHRRASQWLPRAVAVAVVTVVPSTVLVSTATSTPSGASLDPYVVDHGGTLTLGNGIVERTWRLDPFGTTSMVDLRTGVTTGPTDDFALASLVPGLSLRGSDFRVASWDATTTSTGALALELDLEALAGLATVARTYTAFPGVAGFQVDTTVAVPGTWTGYTLDEVALADARATGHAFSAGYDWRGSDTPDWEPAFDPAGSAHTGDHREAFGGTFDRTGQWLSLADDRGRSAFSVIQRVNFDSTHVAFDGTRGRVHVNLADDLIYLGPFEGDIHLDAGVGIDLAGTLEGLGVGLPEGLADLVPRLSPRARVVLPGQTLPLETAFTGFGADPDDEPWQHHRYLVEHRMPRWERGVVFNTNGVDDDTISTGAKDDVDFETFRELAPIARRLGVDTFVLDDGWQAASGDWCPDSPTCPEPRKDRTGFPDRFPDDTFAAVREVLDDHGMSLGLWMTPMHFNTGSNAIRSAPEWSLHSPRRPARRLQPHRARRLVQRGGARHVEPPGGQPRHRADPDRPRRVADPPGHRALRRPLLQVRLPRVARLRRCGARRHVRPPRGVPGHGGSHPRHPP